MNSEINTDFVDEQDYGSSAVNSSLETIFLTSSQVNEALELSQRMTEPGHRWAIYLNALALIGFRQWLNTRTTPFQLDEADALILAPAIADGVSAVCQLRAGQFRLCLIATPAASHNIQMPQLVLQQPDLMAHFYLPITVYEEQAAIALPGFLRCDRLQQQQVRHPFTPNPDHTYSLPHQWLEPDLDHLLLYLSSLDPAIMPLPQPIRQPRPQPLSQRIHQIFVQPVVNTAQWFQAEVQHQVAATVQHCRWLTLPPAALASAMRELPSYPAWRELQPQILPQLATLPASGATATQGNAYCQLQLGGMEFHLQAIVTLVEAPETEPEWSLLLILRQPTDQPLPEGLSLEVHDWQTLQLVQRLQVSASAGCLFTEVIGAVTEQFVVTIALANGLSMTLPTLQFHPSAL